MGLLTTASPCALVLVPLAYVSAIAAITSRCPPSILSTLTLFGKCKVELHFPKLHFAARTVWRRCLDSNVDLLAGRRGMLIKGGKVLDALGSCSTIAFDKTGEPRSVPSARAVLGTACAPAWRFQEAALVLYLLTLRHPHVAPGTGTLTTGALACTGMACLGDSTGSGSSSARDGDGTADELAGQANRCRVTRLAYMVQHTAARLTCLQHMYVRRC